VGASVVATVEPHETVVLQSIRELGLERPVIFNKGAVMILPPGINKASGLARALAELGLSARNLVAAGDAENDHALLDAAEYSVAVSNAITTLKQAADRVTTGARVVTGQGCQRRGRHGESRRRFDAGHRRARQRQVELHAAGARAPVHRGL